MSSNANAGTETAGTVVRPEYWNLPSSGLSRLRVLLARAFRRRCPLCGSSGIFKNWFTIKDRCPRCGYQYARESGYFLGAYPLNLVAAELIPVLLMVGLLVWTDVSWILLEAILIPLAVGLPFLFFPYAQMVWLAIDLFITPVNQR
ncbi:MAG: DUF983 domain-containing protein [Thermomicrobiales bacterium]|nr:DUF983 domain-containing protein [Thermomicrobiales bacterium]